MMEVILSAPTRGHGTAEGVGVGAAKVYSYNAAELQENMLVRMLSHPLPLLKKLSLVDQFPGMPPLPYRLLEFFTSFMHSKLSTGEANRMYKKLLYFE